MHGYTPLPSSCLVRGKSLTLTECLLMSRASMMFSLRRACTVSLHTFRTLAHIALSPLRVTSSWMGISKKKNLEQATGSVRKKKELLLVHKTSVSAISVTHQFFSSGIHHATVRLSLIFLSVASAFAVVSAAPLSSQKPFTKLRCKSFTSHPLLDQLLHPSWPNLTSYSSASHQNTYFLVCS